jgi:hypothetical protein
VLAYFSYLWLVFDTTNSTVAICFSSNLLVPVDGSNSFTLGSTSYTGSNLKWVYSSVGIDDVIGFSLLSYVPVFKAWIVRGISWIVNVTRNITWGMIIFRRCLYVSVDWKVSKYCGYVDIKSVCWIHDQSVDNVWVFGFAFAKLKLYFLIE